MLVVVALLEEWEEDHFTEEGEMEKGVCVCVERWRRNDMR